jgi:pimeloyl-ACP methyl ester carboxylesterase
MTKHNPVLLIHGYSASGESFKKWAEILSTKEYDVKSIHVCSYRTLTNEVTVKDLAEGFDRALRLQSGLENDEEFDAIVHSTGMLVLRSWLTTYAGRRKRLKRLIGLAPATFGSPLAHKGRSWLGAIFKGNRQWGPDFLEAGDRVLDALELSSPFTWNLAHKDLIIPDEKDPKKEKALYGDGNDTPYVFVLCGTEGYDGITSLVNEPGMDGTVRWAGCPLNTRKIKIDLTQDPQRETGKRIEIRPWYPNIDIPLVPVFGLNHETIMSPHPEPDGRYDERYAELINLVVSALNVSNKDDFANWHTKAQACSKQNELIKQKQAWQQFVVHVADERGDPISDFYIQLFTKKRDRDTAPLREIEVGMDVHTYTKDPSYRCFHLNLSDLGFNEQRQVQLDNLHLRIIASSGSEYVGYYGFGSEKVSDDAQNIDRTKTWDAQLDISSLLNHSIVRLFHPFTTTLIEIRLNREPLPLDRSSPNEVCWFLDKKPSRS